MAYDLNVLLPPITGSSFFQVVEWATITNTSGSTADLVVTATASANHELFAAIGDLSGSQSIADCTLYYTGIGSSGSSKCANVSDRDPGWTILYDVPNGATVTLALWNGYPNASCSGTIDWSIDSSSSSSSSSSSVGISSSSSSGDFTNGKINASLINQNNYNLIPFTWIKETGLASDLGDNAKLNFVVENSSTPYLDYSLVINRDNSSITKTPASEDATVYVENDTVATHESEIYVDVIARDANGVKNIRLHTEPEKYNFETIDNVFYIPKFTWGTESDTTTTTTTQIIINTLLVGSEDGRFLEIDYDTVTVSKEIQLSYPVNKITQVDGSNNIYISTNDNLYIYKVDYFNDGSDIYLKEQFNNEDRNIISLGDPILAVQAYSGKVVEMDSETLAVNKEHSGFDAPFKVLNSVYHDLKIIAGTNILWTVDSNDVIKSVYGIKGYTIADFDISPEGYLCILFNSDSESIIRILDTDLYSILLDKRLNLNTLRYCKYIGEGRFYILSELNNSYFTYMSEHYVFDIDTNDLSIVSSSTDIIQTTTTTTLGVTTKAVELSSPNGGEGIEKGEEYEIKWVSSKSATDTVKIELYKSGQLQSLVAETTNTGVYAWKVSSDLSDGSDYRIRITWLSASSDTNNYDTSDADFTIGENIPTTTTTTLPELTEYAIGIEYNNINNSIIVVLKSGLFGIFDLSTGVFDGLYDFGVKDITSFVLKDVKIGGINSQSKVRIWVGSEPYYSDKWYAELETDLKSAYYSGGNNLQPGKTYYVNIQIYSEDEGWGDVQSKQFTVPK